MIGRRGERERDERHLQFVRSLSCVICGDNTSVEAAHLRSGDRGYGKPPTGKGKKPDDKWVLPLCSKCHRMQHNMNELKFWEERGIDPFIAARGLYDCGGDITMVDEIFERAREYA